MKKTIIFISLILLAITAFSQEARKGFIGISLGPSIPVSDYGDSDGYNKHAGFAMTGLHVNFNFSYKFNKNLGIAALWTSNTHPIDAEAMIDMFASIEPSLNWKLETGAWSSNNLMAGLLVSVPFEKVDLDIKGLIGFSSSSTPYVDVTASDGINSFNIKQNEASALAFASNLGVGLRYNIVEKIALTVNVDYFSTTPKFEVVTKSDFEYSAYNDVGQPMDMMNISLGIGYRLK